MAFVCPPREEAAKRTKVLGELKGILQKVQEKMAVPCEFVACLPMGNQPAPSQGCSENLSPPNVMVCYKMPQQHNKHHDQKPNKSMKESQKSGDKSKKLKASKSRELRCGILYVDCDCEKRNGLQDDCRRTGCQGAPECMTLPNPTCGPSEFSNAKHIEKKMQEYARARKMAKMKAGSHGMDSGKENDSGHHHHHHDHGSATYQCFPAMIKPEGAQMCVPVTCTVK